MPGEPVVTPGDGGGHVRPRRRVEPTANPTRDGATRATGARALGKAAWIGRVLPGRSRAAVGIIPESLLFSRPKTEFTVRFTVDELIDRRPGRAPVALR